MSTPTASDHRCRKLIVNADDFGRTASINAGIIRGRERGIVTAATVMVRWPHAREACAYARDTGFDVGLHVDLGEWAHVDGSWLERYTVVDLGDARAVAVEIERQLDRFRHLTGADPSHIDSHQHVHRKEPVRSAMKALAARLGVPVRGGDRCIAYEGSFHGQDSRARPVPDAVGADALVALIGSLPHGTTEIGCHPATRADGHSAYDAERPLELAALCDRRVVRALADSDVTLCCYADLHDSGAPVA